MKRIILFLSLFLFAISTKSVDYSVYEVLKKVDNNQNPHSIIYRGSMLIHRRGKTIEKKFEIWASGNKRSFVEFTYPPRDKGTKYLRIDDNLWMYLPKAEKTVKISGHMLKQSIMGSDFSYDDQTDNTGMSDNYTGNIVDQDLIDSRECIILDISAKEDSNPNYFRQKIWVDKEDSIILKAELYGRSGKLLKILTSKNFRKINNRIYALYSKMEDNIKNQSYTEIIIHEIELDKKIDENIFTLRNLEKK
jgi:outer membrane lipoprotein-sorting protein